MVTITTGPVSPKTNVLVHLMPDELEVGDLCAVLDQPPHVLAIGLVNVVVDCFQVQAVHGGTPPVTAVTRLAAESPDENRRQEPQVSSSNTIWQQREAVSSQ